MTSCFIRNTGRAIRRVCCRLEIQLLDLPDAERRQYYKPIKFFRRLAEECRELVY